MKHILVLFALLWPLTIQAQSLSWGIADTLSHHSIGPGVFFTELIYPEKPLAIYITTVDLTNPHNLIESYPSNGKVPDASGQTTSAQCKDNTTEAHRVVMGINHDFFDINGGVAIGTNIRNGEMTHNGEWQNGKLMNRAVLTIDDTKRANILNPVYFMNIIFPDQKKMEIEMVNDRSDDLHQTKKVVLYNRFNSKELKTPGTYATIKPLDIWTFNGDPIRCIVESTGQNPIQPNSEQYVLRLLDDAAVEFTSKATTGDTIRIEQLLRAISWGAHTPNILQAFHGYPSIIRRGELHAGEYDNFENSATWPNGRAYEVANRTMAGISRDGRTLFLVVVDGRRPGWSIGLNCIETALFMVELGAYHVVNFDGGGSSTMVVNEEVKNKPTDSSGERKVMNTLQVISNAPVNPTPHTVSFRRTSILMQKYSSIQLEYFVYNQHGDPISTHEGILFSMTPGLKGTITQKGELYVNEASEGYVIATIGDNADSIYVKVNDTNTSIEEKLNSFFSCYPSIVENGTTIRYTVNQPSYITLSLYDFMGKRIETFVSNFHTPGTYEYSFIRTGQKAGIYFLLYQSDSRSNTLKLIFR